MNCNVLKTVLVMSLVVAHAAWAGQLRIGTARVSGDQVTVPILLNGDVGKGVSTLDFHLNYDPALFEPLAATAGAAATAADKSVQANAPAKGEYVVIMMGLNQNTVTSGEVANIVLRKVGSADSGKANLSVSQTTFASPEGVNIPSQGDQGVIQLSGKTPSTGTDQTGDTTTSTSTSGTATGTPGKDATGATTKPGASTAGSAAGAAQTTTTRTPGSAAGGPAGTQSLTGTGNPSVKGGVAEVGGLAAAVKRVDAAHSTLQDQTGGGAKSGGDGTPGVGDGASKGAPDGETSAGVDKTPGSGGTMQLAKVVTPDGVRQGEKKELEKRDLLVVESSSAKKSDSNLVLKVALGGLLVVILGAVFVIRRKLFT
jgi:hypothetical protein